MTAMKDLVIGIVGNGVVGSATAAAFRDHVKDVLVWDVKPERSNCCRSDLPDCGLVFICLPTPQKEGRLDCDTSAVEEELKLWSENYGRLRHTNLVLKSTVPVGFTRQMKEQLNLPNLVHSPEFLTARTAVEDAANPTRNIIGYPYGVVVEAKPLELLYAERWPNVPIYHMSSDESEVVKLIQNSFSAVKIAAFNEFRSFCEVRGLSWDSVLGAVLAGGWISPHHTQVPGPDGLHGFGGSCLPKDLVNLITCMFEAHVAPEMLSAAWRRNLMDRPKETR